MEEIAEFRVDEKYASLLLEETEGKKIGSSVRLLRIKTSDPRFVEIGRIQSRLRAEIGKPFFYGWNLERKPNREEINRAELFLLRTRGGVEPSGEECGTAYDEFSACPVCGSGALQVSPLFLDVRRLPKNFDVVSTIAGEIVVSRRAVEALRRHGVRGVSFGEVRTRSNTNTEEWFQLVVNSSDAIVSAQTLIGIDPFDQDSKGEYRCPLGDLVGLNLLSGVSIAASSGGDADIFASKHFIGWRSGLLRPERLIFISAKVRNLMLAERLKPVGNEIVELV